MNETKKKKVILALCAVAIAVVFFFAGFGTGYNVGKGADSAPTLTTGHGGMVITTGDAEGTDKGVSLVAEKIERANYEEYGIMPIAEEAYTVTATVIGESLTEEQKNVTWSAAAFKNPSSEWATGKNVSEYVTATPNKNQLTVQCLEAFGEQIIIKCTSSFNTAVSKDLTVDYMENLEIAHRLIFQAPNRIQGDREYNFNFDLSKVIDSNLSSITLGLKRSPCTLSYSGPVFSGKLKIRVYNDASNTSTNSFLGQVCKKIKIAPDEISSHFPSYEFSVTFNSNGFLSSDRPAKNAGTWNINNFFDSTAFESFCLMSEWSTSSVTTDRFLDAINSVITGSQLPFKITYEVVFESNGVSEQLGLFDLLCPDYTNWYAQKSISIDFGTYNNGMTFNEN